MQGNQTIPNQIDGSLDKLDLISDEPNSTYNTDQDNLEECFFGAPSWIRRR